MTATSGHFRADELRRTAPTRVFRKGVPPCRALRRGLREGQPNHLPGAERQTTGDLEAMALQEDVSLARRAHRDTVAEQREADRIAKREAADAERQARRQEADARRAERDARSRRA